MEWSYSKKQTNKKKNFPTEVKQFCSEDDGPLFFHRPDAM